MLARLRAMHRWPLWARLGLATASVLAAHLLQVLLETEIPGEPFLLFYLIVIAVTALFGMGVGLYGVALSTLLCLFFFEPSYTFALHHASDLVKIELYALLAGASVVGLTYLTDALMAADEARQALVRSETANSVLLRELGHRVANNFAAVASLIRRKANLVDDSEAKSVLNEAVEQVMVLARVHNRLRTESDEVSLDSKSFIEELCGDLKVLIASGRPVSIESHSVSRSLSVAQAIPLGLVVNELVTNAIKYAFPEGRAGTVRVILQEAGGCLRLRVEDDGVGLDAGRIRSSGIGHELVRALCQQLGGMLEVESTSHGSRFSVAFPSAIRAAPAASRDRASTLHRAGTSAAA
jgi:two-component sensor histidine kinase